MNGLNNQKKRLGEISTVNGKLLKDATYKNLSADQLIMALIEQNKDLADMLQNVSDRQFEIKTIPNKYLIRGKQAFQTRFLEAVAPNNQLTFDWPFMITHIYRCPDTYDVIDTSTINYDASLIQILRNNDPISTIPFDVSALPMTRKLAMEFPTPLFVDQGDTITLQGGAGLTKLRIGLYGYRVYGDDVPNEHDLLQPFFLCAYVKTDSTIAESSKDINMFKWMNIDIKKSWSFNRIKPATIDDAGYADYDHTIVTPGDPLTYSGNAELNVDYQHHSLGQGFNWNIEFTSNWTGTREFPSNISDLFPDLGQNMKLRCNPVAITTGVPKPAWIYRWIMILGAYNLSTPSSTGQR